MKRSFFASVAAAVLAAPLAPVCVGAGAFGVPAEPPSSAAEVAAAAAPKVQITLSAPTRVRFAGKATLSGRVAVEGAGQAGATAVLMRRTTGSEWREVKTLKLDAAGRFSTKVLVRSKTKFRVIGRDADINNPVAFSPARTVALKTGSASQRAVYEAALKFCQKYNDSVDKTTMWVSRGPKSFATVGKRAAGPLSCNTPGQADPGAFAFWQKSAGAWKPYYMTQNTPECKKFDDKGWPVKLTGRTCWDTKTSTERPIRR